MIRKHSKTVLIHAIGWILIILGILLGFVPFIPGVVLILLGLYFISLRAIWAKKLLEWMRDKLKIKKK